MRTQRTPAHNGGIAVAHGYGLKIHVHNRHLVITDGLGRDRRTRRFHRATSRLKRLVLIGHTGYITLDALRWLRDIGAALVHIDADGQLITTSTLTGPDLAPLRRAQALAASSPAGVQIARDLLHAKVSGQAALLAELRSGQARPELDQALRDIAAARHLSVLLAAEAQAANAYWNAWAELAVPIAGRDSEHVPDHWRTFGRRHSLLSNGPRLACNPPNAILNYLYALLEAEAILACHRVGLDPGVGIFHADRRDRASLALDVIEAVRPIVDAYVLALLTQRTLARGDFAETRQGACRMHPRLTARLAETTETWRRHIAPVVEGVARTLATDAGWRGELPTPLTQRARIAAWDSRAPDRRRRQPRAGMPVLPATCRDCGTELADRRRRYCEQCRKQRWVERATHARANAAEVLAQLRAEQRDPAHGGKAAAARGVKNAAHQAAVRTWAGECPDPAVFQVDILPGLRGVPIAHLVAATGLSEHYCSLIRLGKRVPHPRHWRSLEAIAKSDNADQ